MEKGGKGKRERGKREKKREKNIPLEDQCLVNGEKQG